jgi:transcriptional regulator with XRE-family HTH domain/quercetin dioxygenase-like cupin family protein
VQPNGQRRRHRHREARNLETVHPELIAGTKLGADAGEPVETATETGPDARGADARTRAHELIGGRLREARLRSGLGVRELSRQLEISASSISQIELGRVVPSVSTLYALTNALNISMDSLFVADADDVAEPPVGQEQVKPDGGAVALPPARLNPATSAHERAVVLRRNNRRVIDLERGVRWELLTPVPEPGAEFLEVHYPAGSESSANGQAIRHNGRDYCLVLEGSLRVQIGFEEYVLNAGDSLAFDATNPHRFWNAGDVAVRAVWFVLDRWLPHGGGTDWSTENSRGLTPPG